LLAGLESQVRSYEAERAVVALSGGVDSALVAAVAARALGPERVTAATAASPSYPEGELDAAREVAQAIGIEHRVVPTIEVEQEAYARNDARRCFHCKTELYTTLTRLFGIIGRPGNGSGERAGIVILSGANVDDLGDFRPGLAAGDSFGVRSPLLEAGLGKDEIRALARHLGLTVADKPAMACLSSRVAFGVRITPELLARIDRAERAVRRLGFDPVRVRHFGAAASIEVDPERVSHLEGHPRLPRLSAELRAMGWEEIRVDPAGYRPGSMNATLVDLRRRSTTPAGANRALTTR
jgi:pyridinium-3,5-biscarboxylic acid mononucleotide sulfurtransferase